MLLVLEAGLAVLLIVIYAARRHHARAHVRPAVVGGAAAGVTACVLLAYPVWLIVAGPAHYSGSIHPGLSLSSFGGSAQRFFLLARPAVHGAFSAAFFHIVGGYQGPVLSGQYFGLGALMVCLVGVAVWRRQRLLWLFGILAVVSMFLVTSSGPFIGSLPVLKNVVPSHFVLFAYLAVAVLLAVIIDNTRTALKAEYGREATAMDPPRPGSRRGASGRWPGAAGRAGRGVHRRGTPCVHLAQGIPFTVQPIVLPNWFRTVAPHLQRRPVVLALPAPFSATKSGLKWTDTTGRRYPLILSGKQAAMTWQALSGQRFSMVGSGGLGAGTVRSGVTNAGQNVISLGDLRLPDPAGRHRYDFEAVQRALRDGGSPPWCCRTSRSCPSTTRSPRSPRWWH